MHQPTAPDRDTGTLVWGWIILALTSGTSLAFNIRHAVAGPSSAALPLPFAVLYGLMPVAVALALSHTIARRGGGRVEWTIGGAVFLTALALSVTAIADTLTPFAGMVHAYAFAIMLDVASLMGLRQVIAATAARRGRHVRTGVDIGGQDRTASDGSQPSATVPNETERPAPDTAAPSRTVPDTPLPDVRETIREAAARPAHATPPLWQIGADHPDVRPPIRPAARMNGTDAPGHTVTHLVSNAQAVRELAADIRAVRAAGGEYAPDFEALSARYGRGRSWAEKRLAAARRLVAADPDIPDGIPDARPGGPDVPDAVGVAAADASG